MADNFIYLTYVHLMIITSQEKHLPVKEDFERWAATFGVRIHRSHVDNKIFSE